MTRSEVIDGLEIIAASIEWDTSIYNQVVIDEAKKYVNAFFKAREEMVKYREQMLFSHNNSYAAMADMLIAKMDKCLKEQ